jgi:hypothetical protein
MSIDMNGNVHTPAGTSAGGQFATQQREESQVRLVKDPAQVIERLIARGELSPGARGMVASDAIEQWAQANGLTWAERVLTFEDAGLRMPLRGDDLAVGDRFDVAELLAGHGEVEADELVRTVSGDAQVQMARPSADGKVYLQVCDDDGEYVGQMWIPDCTQVPVRPSPWRCYECGGGTRDGEGHDGLCGTCADTDDREPAGVCDRCNRDLSGEQVTDGYCPDCDDEPSGLV